MMDKADTTGTTNTPGHTGTQSTTGAAALQTTLTLRMEGLTAGDSIMVEFSGQLPNARIYFPTSGPALWMYIQMPGDPVQLRYAELQPRRLELQLAAATEVLTVALAVTCDQPFVYGWLHVPGAVRATISTHVETLNLVGGGYWALPMGMPGQGSSTNPPLNHDGQQKEI
jgi:hypothetical protein